MTTAAPEVTARRNLRTALRDQRTFSETGPGTGANSSVSPEALTRVAHGAAAVAAPSARPSTALSGDLAASFRAASLPQAGPGQNPRTTNAGERPQTGSGKAAKGKDGPAR
ncbi:hypothetical protein ACIBL3_23175 [Kribbella sp. NPDC050124]|uniref:hypothetical protein n=1 Tax=Kribbella sp. NPDC050124 TaxID=3364114 RepID=UPI0037AF0956